MNPSWMGNVTFVRGAVRTTDFPPEDRPFVLVAGRSNCGKSSLLNALFKTRSLARVSKTPGRTTELNFFDVAGQWFIVDLPGYGYAAQAARKRASWDEGITQLIADPRTRLILVLADCRRKPEPEEVQLSELAAHYGKTIQPILTKSDKLGRHEQIQAVARWRSAEWCQSPGALVASPLLTSARTGVSVDELWDLLKKTVTPEVDSPIAATIKGNEGTHACAPPQRSSKLGRGGRK